MAPDGKSENGTGNAGTSIPPDFKFITREYRTSDLPQMLDLVLELEAELAEKFKDVQIKSGSRTTSTVISSREQSTRRLSPNPMGSSSAIRPSGLRKSTTCMISCPCPQPL